MFIALLLPWRVQLELTLRLPSSLHPLAGHVDGIALPPVPSPAPIQQHLTLAGGPDAAVPRRPPARGICHAGARLHRFQRDAFCWAHLQQARHRHSAQQG